MCGAELRTALSRWAAPLFGAGLALGALSRSTRAAAQVVAPRASLVVIRGDGAERCPDAPALAAQVRRIVGADVLMAPAEAEAQTASVDSWLQVALTRDVAGYRAQISAFGRRQGTRTLEDVGPSCASLAEAVAVTISIILDPYADSALPSAPLPATEPQGAPASAPPNASPPPLFLSVGSGISFSLLAHTQPLIAAGLGIQPVPRWSFALGGVLVLADRVASAGGDVDLHLAYGYLEGCTHARVRATLSLDWCARPLLGVLSGSGRGFRNSFSRRAPWVALAVGPRASFELGRSWAWLFESQLITPLLRPAFDVRSDGQQAEVFRSPSVAGAFSLALRGRL